MHSLSLAFAIVSLLAFGPAVADTVDFTKLPPGNLGTKRTTVDGVTFAGPKGLFNSSSIHFPDNGGSICSFNPAAFNCENDMTIKFNGRVRRLTLAASGYDAGDQATVTAYRGKKVVGSVVLTSDQAINFKGAGRVTRLVVDDQGTGNGFGFGEFQFKRLTTTAPTHFASKSPKAGK